jgi:hypothetical protein
MTFLGIQKLNPLLKEDCQGLRKAGDLVSLVLPESLPDQQDKFLDGDDNIFFACTARVVGNQVIHNE